MTVTTRLTQEKMGERHFLPPEDPFDDQKVDAWHNLEYVIGINTWGQHDVIRKGFAGETTSSFHYSVRGTIMLKPIDKNKENEGFDDGNFRVFVRYDLGEPQGASVKSTGDCVTDFWFTKENLEGLCGSFPQMGMIGKVVIATNGQLPGDTEKQVFLDMFEEAVVKNQNFQRYAQAHHAFLEAYQTAGEQS